MRRFTPLVVVLALLVVSCGGDDGPSVEDATSELAINMTEFEFDPAETVVPGGEEITLDLTNSGSVEHNWVLLNAGERVETEEEYTEDMAYYRAELQPGEAGTFTFTAPGERGIYQVICIVPGHLTAGMEGRLTVAGDQ